MSEIKQIIVVKKEGQDGISYHGVDINKYDGSCDEKALSHSYVMDTMRKTMGRTLTVIDACIPVGNQNKSMKDLIRSIYSDEMNFLADITYDQQKMITVAEELSKDMSDEELIGTEVTIEEALGIK